jgi:hypothetical protein
LLVPIAAGFAPILLVDTPEPPREGPGLDLVVERGEPGYERAPAFDEARDGWRVGIEPSTSEGPLTDFVTGDNPRRPRAGEVR